MSDDRPAPATILLVDDEPSILSALRRQLRKPDLRILTAEGGAAGLALLETEPVDLVISDMRMPEMDGVQFLEQVRQRWPKVVRILLTGYADISSTIGAINRGEIHRYISKPWDDHDIQLCVSDGLKRQRLELENQRLSELTLSQNKELQDVNGLLQGANDELQAVNAQLQQANSQLAGVNEELERRVAERTRELELAMTQLAASHAEMEKANEKLNAANLQLEENFALSISVFSGLLELRDGSVAGHGHRVATLARRIAQQLQISGIEETDIYNAGLLHEVGKIGLPDELMRKTVSLMNGAEFSRYKQHPVQAQAALMPLGRLRQTAILIRSQHERIDGKGYPDGLSGYEVPLGSQIINIASTYESLIAGKLAEKVFSTEDACKAIHEGGEQRYDAEVLAAFDKAMAELALEQGQDQEVLAAGLRPGMVLARDLLSPHGSLLLPAGFRFSAPLVKQVQELAQRDNVELVFFVKKDGAARAPARTAAQPVQHA
ncbi:response regulator [Paucibacter sp. APW11]|uniref:Response regulator n=1 Tax=Roseateles aquae TaxID=3077235 RepID=A0ABU3PAD7_9BURK|nr:HD domain-containing phosphohydrolase [Paucibacter sp. APW11]MDT8999537.1 response regulator [Paucibacter sp. APW11]